MHYGGTSANTAMREPYSGTTCLDGLLKVYNPGFAT